MPKAPEERGGGARDKRRPGRTGGARALQKPAKHSTSRSFRAQRSARFLAAEYGEFGDLEEALHILVSDLTQPIALHLERRVRAVAVLHPLIEFPRNLR